MIHTKLFCFRLRKIYGNRIQFGRMTKSQRLSGTDQRWDNSDSGIGIDPLSSLMESESELNRPQFFSWKT